MNQPAGEITLTPDHYSQHLLPSDSTQEEEDADEAISDLGFTASVKSCYMFGSFHSPSSEETNVTPISGAENKAVDNQVCRKLLQDDSVTKFCLDSFASIASDDLFGSLRSPSNEQLNFTPLLSAEDQTKDIDDPGKLLLPVSEDTVSILDESCLHANVSQVILLQSEEPRAQGFDGRSRDNANSHPDNAYFPGTIPLSGTFTSQLSSSFGQSIDFTNVNSDYASPITMKMECSRENKIVLEYSDPDIDHHNIPWKTTSSRTGPILLKSSRARQCMTDKTFNKSTATQSQNRLVPVSSTEEAGSDEDEDGQADTCQGQIYHSPDNKDLDVTMKSLEISLPLVKTPLHSGTFIQEIHFSSPEEQLIIGEYSPNNALPQATPGVPSHDVAILIPNMPQTHAEVCLQRLTMPQPNIDAEVPSIGVPQPVAGKPMQHLPTSSQPAFPPPQLSLMDSMASLRPLVDSQAPQGAFSVHKAPRDITGHGSTALRTVRKEDENYVDMSGCQIQYKNALVNKNVHPGKTNFEELQQISYDCQPYAEEGFESDMEASSNVQVDPSESEMNTSSHPTVERLSLEDDAERFSSVDSDGYARFKERDDVDYLTPVFRDHFKPLKVRPKSSAEFPLPPVPGVQKRPFSVAAVPGDQKRSFSVADHHRNTELPPFQTVTEEIKSKQEKDQEADESQKMIRVRGLKSSHSLHALELFFENEKKSGGGEIEKLEWKKNKEEAVITFKHPSVVKSVLEKQKRESFYLEETRLTVEEYVPFSPDPIRLFLKNLSPSTTQELLVLYLEPCCKAIPVEILFKRLPGTALVTFSEPPDVKKLLVRVKEKPFEGQYIQVIRVPITRQFN
ncbi:hypothetical protein CHS0354_013667 [Potamilus streckersoni]|uniref:RRM domain-containing protein n=1 Tax=Potamilus streckersoni TaxID=2493646 RepID=A0AAE0SUF6_9BIVA|nr:hypothetical protein CHS0354_013667 [Potamilus streckersoni]